MHYVDEGESGNSPVLMVHGNPTWSYYWRHLIGAVRDRYRAVAVDHLGCGMSELPRDEGYTLDARIDHLVEFVRKLDLSAITLVVHDWGGAIGLGAALRELDRYRALVLLNTGAFPPPYFPWRIRVCRTPLVGRFAVQGLNLFARAATWMATTQRGGLPTEARRGLLAPYNSWSRRRAIYEFVADIPTRDDEPTMQRLIQIESDLHRFNSLPVLMLWGMKDWCFRPECLKIFQSHLPGARTVEFPDAGHFVMEDARDEVIGEIRRFLDGESPQQ